MGNSTDFGTIFDIQHFSISDGPGIRTTVFLKGCPLRCVWCHNPESYTADTQIMFYPQKCVGCGTCVAVCPRNCHVMKEQIHEFHRNECIHCQKCTDSCLFDSLKPVGRIVSVSEILEQVLEDSFFYESSGGGLTLSGGEPMFQADFAINIARRAKEKGLHVCIETSGFCRSEKFKEILPYVDLFLFDYKVTGKVKHKQYTGVDSELIIYNLYLLDSMGAHIILRCPMIPEVNTDAEHTAGIIAVARGLRNLIEIHLEPYHNIGISKRDSLGMKVERIAQGACSNVPSADSRLHPQPSREKLLCIAQEIEAAVGAKVLVL